ncbi:UDP-N-acetylglucosamine 1-carboxyvinyltransferase [Francisella frigiditurris]|uniref:UDP-N-acetylglucosamine 1-carboxyvinyltransferase n=1 Tax=Francisella frigiditurris TaxID=1542390 RepID=A0A1J0KV10_9GAMM|nr:UDP-N-acetylglucosamine 1-carboxyvinyltransferase [Francisella frigiditurris]APC97514.1 EPSP synthase family protein [Francisella frigiditurris]
MKTVRVRKLDKIADEITINISGAKNALLHLIFASLIPETETTFLNVPTTLLDYKGAKEILESIGAKVKEKSKDIVCINTKGIDTNTLELSEELTSKTRCSLMLLGSMLKKKGKVKIGFPGGCSFSDKRPFDIHLQGLEELGAEVKLADDHMIVAYKEEKDAVFKMGFPSVGATMNLVMYAVIGSSKVVLENVALEPEVVTLIDYLNKCGAKIDFDSDARVITIHGVAKLKGCEFEIIFDRIQAMTYAAMAYLYKTNVTITNINAELYNIQKPLDKLIAANAKWEHNPETRSIKFFGKDSELNGVDIIAAPFPHFPTDLQPIYAMMLLMAKDPSTIQDTVYPERINYVYQIRKMGFDVSIDNNLIRINPIKNLEEVRAAIMSVKDLRAGMACLMAGSLLEDFSTINNAHQIFRGYNDLVENMSNFMQIELVADQESD